MSDAETQRAMRRQAVVLPPFQRLVDLHAEVVMRFLVRHLGPVDAEDCFQETFLAALSAYPRVRDTSNLRGWLLTIARHKMIDSHRHARRRPLTGLEGVDGSVPAPEPAGPAMWDAVRGLPDKQRAAVARRFAADQSYEEIARAMGTSPEAARRSVHEGIKRLRRGAR